ncbi:MAG TPA: hypothetical protein VE262_20645 [Blastocatellia bacterium]|nr:hypothetical protein [Blastocatellia bacterium]
MAMKKRWGRRRRRYRDMIEMSPDPRAEGAAQPGPDTRPSGIIRFETGKLPSEFAEFDKKGRSNRPGGVVMTIVALALIIIAIIAWAIANEPPK